MDFFRNHLIFAEMLNYMLSKDRKYANAVICSVVREVCNAHDLRFMQFIDCLNIGAGDTFNEEPSTTAARLLRLVREKRLLDEDTINFIIDNQSPTVEKEDVKSPKET